MPGLLRGMARTAVIAGTATSVSNRVSRRQGNRWAAQEDAQNQQQEQYAQPAPAAAPAVNGCQPAELPQVWLIEPGQDLAVALDGEAPEAPWQTTLRDWITDLVAAFNPAQQNLGVRSPADLTGGKGSAGCAPVPCGASCNSPARQT